MNELEELRQQREENFTKIGQYQLQKMYYEQDLERLLKEQQKLCDKIFILERKSS